MNKQITYALATVALLGAGFFIGHYTTPTAPSTPAVPAETTAPLTTETTAPATTEPLTEEVVPEAAPLPTLVINGCDVEIDPTAPNLTWFDPIQMTSEYPNTFALGTLEGYDVLVDGQPLTPGDTVDVSVDTLGHAYGISLELVDTATQTHHQYYIRTLHSLYNLSTAGQGDGYYYFGQEGTLYKLNGDGDVVFFKQESTRVYDFMPNVMDDGTVYYSYMEIATKNTNEQLPNTGYGRTRAIIMNERYEIVDEIDFLHTGQGMPDSHSLESHEFEMLDLGHYILSGYVGTQVDNIPTDVDDDGQAYVVAAVFQEVKDGELLFQWNSTEHPELYGYSFEKNDFDCEDPTIPQDYAHYNALDIDPKDGNFIVSFRNLDAVVKIHRTTGEIIWILGGAGDQFGISETQQFSRQHFCKFFSDGTITLFDNGYATGQTRALEFVLDEANKTISDFHAYQIDYAYGNTMGSAQRLSQEENIFLMGWGSRSPDGVLFSEVNFDTGEILFQAMDFDTTYGQNTYRAYNFDV